MTEILQSAVVLVWSLLLPLWETSGFLFQIPLGWHMAADFQLQIQREHVSNPNQTSQERALIKALCGLLGFAKSHFSTTSLHG